ncbi:MAG: TatD family deoxyribonuclease [Candidatus Microsaccharimonas sossegonensis]|uniref:TatD family deoxyribonuclease n=1 Tax=Candidatus Microsaccharimonas sossegonensis TaxID=2506948 RepID=A0A4Q0AGI6_9BACT|nr:MAG: TatD family deoxyribonuclease [Candidatus Microsaccharimonas sossegonensis]
MFIDTHCHIHEADFPLSIDETLSDAKDAGVDTIICVGTSEASSRAALTFATSHQYCWASIGVHPHDTKDGYANIESLAHSSQKIVAIGEIGLDYFYTNSPKDVQIKALEDQIKVAVAHDLPIIFHVRDAFDDFWPIFNKYPGIRGELHSFTDTKANLDIALEKGLYIGVNGISTFTKDEAHKEMFDSIPLDRLLLETDAPFLTPIPFRGKVNQPAYVRNIAEYHAKRRGISLIEIASATTANAKKLFAI